MVSEPRPTSGGLKVKPAAAAAGPEGAGPAAKAQTPEAGVKAPSQKALAKVAKLNDLLSTPDTKMTYAIVRGRNNVIITLTNRDGAVKVTISTAIGNRFVNGFSVRALKKIVLALNDLYNDIAEIKPELVEPEKRETNVKIY